MEDRIEINSSICVYTDIDSNSKNFQKFQKNLLDHE